MVKPLYLNFKCGIPNIIYRIHKQSTKAFVLTRAINYHNNKKRLLMLYINEYIGIIFIPTPLYNKPRWLYVIQNHMLFSVKLLETLEIHLEQKKIPFQYRTQHRYCIWLRIYLCFIHRYCKGMRFFYTINFVSHSLPIREENTHTHTYYLT